MASVVDIYNLALAKLGISFEIESVGEQTKHARVMNRFYPISRDFVLRDFPWPCAKRIVALSLASSESFIGWTYVYTYPDSCLFIQQVVDASGARILSRSLGTALSEQSFLIPRYPFSVAIKDDESSRLVLTDLSEAYALFTKRLENTEQFDSGLIDTLAWRLAAEAGPTLQVDKDYIGNAWQNYNAWRLSAHANAMNESQQDSEADSPSISIR